MNKKIARIIGDKKYNKLKRLKNSLTIKLTIIALISASIIS